MNPVYLASRVASIAADSRWCGGVRRDHLRELLGCDYRELDRAIAIAYRRRLVDLCWGWVVAPRVPAIREPAA